jgi:D-lactate dehydrogenase
LEDYRYAGLDTCAVDGLCATACPVTINTGDLVKHLRADAATPRNRRLALLLVRQFKALEMAARIGIRLGHVVEKIIGVKGILAVSRAAERLTGLNLPKWNAAVLHPTGHIPATSRQGAEYIYFPSCISRTMGTPAMAAGTPSLIETFLIVAERAKVKVWIPEDAAGHCCGMPFGSKGYQAANQEMLHRTIASFWDWSEGGRLPVVIDTTSCTYTLRTCSDNLSTEDQEKWQQMTILDSLEFIHDGLLPRLPVKPLSADVILHPNCGARKMNLAGKMESIARVCSRQVTIPQALDCCAFAGDRGLLFPELTASATAWEAAEVNAGSHDGYYCSNLTCEMGMSAATGKPYRSILYLVEQATRNP